MQPGPHPVWCCPHHHGGLTESREGLVGECCGTAFPVVAGIPDLRVQRAAWVDLERDQHRARDLEAQVPPTDLEGSVRRVFGSREGWTPAMVERRTRLVLGAVEKLRQESRGWLGHVIGSDGPLLEVGCGPGMFLAALDGKRPLAGIDVSMEWLIVARRLTAAAGIHADLAAAHAEALPLRTASVGAVVALDVLEHVGDQHAMLSEIDRVLRLGGVFAAATPNRFSLAAEPHVSVWGVGWLPRAWQGAYVRWRSGLTYDYVRLLSARDIRRLIRDATTLRARVVPAPVPESDLRAFSPRRRVLGRLYNAMLRLGPFRAAARWLGPFFHIVAIKPGAES